ncbi:MAG: hypothetical protein ACOYM2_08415 [Rectinemataceae bacterium]
MKRILSFFAAGLVVFGLMSCQLLDLAGISGGTSGTIQTSAIATSASLKAVPRSLTIEVPTSLVGSTAAARSMGGMGGFGGMGGPGGAMMGGHDFDRGMGAHFWIMRSLWDSQARLARGAATIVAIDSVIAADSLLPSATAVSGTSVTWTQAMVDSVTALLPSAFAKNSQFSADAMLPALGSVKVLPDFTYDLVPASDTTNYGVYARMITIASEALGNGTGVETRSFYWSEDKTKVKFEAKASSGTTVVDQTFVAYDSATLTMSSGRIDGHGTATLEIKADSTTVATHGTFLTYQATINKGDLDSALAGDGTVTIAADGYADDNGGTVTDTITVTTSTGTTEVYYLKEVFGADGSLTSAEYSTDKLTWTSLASAPPAISDLYSHKAGMAGPGKMGMGGLGGEMRQDMDHHGDFAGAGPGAMRPPRPSEIANSAITTGVWVAASDAGFTSLIGTGISREVGKLIIGFISVPADGAKYYIAPVVSGKADVTAVIELTYSASN